MGKILASTSKNQSAHRSKNTVPDQNLIKNATKFHGKIVTMYRMKFVIWSLKKTAKMCLITIANKFPTKIVTPSIKKFPSKFLKKGLSEFAIIPEKNRTDLLTRKLQIMISLN